MIMFIQCIICTLSGVFIYFGSAVTVYVLYSKDYPCYRRTGFWGRHNVVSGLWLSLVLEYNILMNSSEIEPIMFYDE